MRVSTDPLWIFAPYAETSRQISCCWVPDLDDQTSGRVCSLHFTKWLVAGRQLIPNAVDLDFAAKSQTIVFCKSQDDRTGVFEFGSESSSHNLVHRDPVDKMPISVLFDFAMAFPTASHAWIFFHLLFHRNT